MKWKIAAWAPRAVRVAGALPRLKIWRRCSLIQLLALGGVIRKQKFWPDVQFARVVDVIERDQIVIGNLELFSDRYRIVAFGDGVNLAGVWRRLCIFCRRFGGGARRFIFSARCAFLCTRRRRQT